MSFETTKVLEPETLNPYVDLTVTDEFSSIHKYFEKQVESSPDATALISEHRTLTFSELDARANVLASRLKERCSGPEAIVGVFLPRSIEAVIALLACFKAGCVQLPIGMNYPASFIEFILDDAKPEVIITSSDQELDTHIETLCIDCMKLDEQSSLSVSTDWPGDFHAWILYTSGSTGTPKAVKGLHRGIVQRCKSLWTLQPFSEHEVAIQNTGLTVVDSHWELWGALSKGIPVVLLDENINQNPIALINALRVFKVTRICLVPSLLRSMLCAEEQLGRELPSLHEWIVSGELLSTDLIKMFYRSLPDAVLRNQYGLTETSADITSYDTRNMTYDLISNDFAPVGTPFPGVELHILNEQLMPVDDGQEGELFVGGDCVVDGYFNRPELSTQRFVETAHCRTGEKLLATGDLARRLGSGDIFISGRADRQVKIRGFRVELDGLESMVYSHDDVVSAAAISEQSSKGHSILIVYVQVTKSSPLSPETIREYCRSRAPAHMVPHKVILLDSMPRTSSGKIDRKSLPKVSHLDIDIVDRSDLSKTEDELRRIWCDLLGLPDIGTNEVFFKAGGDSLMMMMMLTEVRKKFNYEVSLQDFVLNPTIEHLSSLLNSPMVNEQKLVAGSYLDSKIETGHENCDAIEDERWPLCISQSSIYLHEQVELEGNPYGIANAVALIGKVDLDILKTAATHVMKTDPVLSLRISMKAGELKQYINDGENVCFDVIRPRRILKDTKELYINDQIIKVASMRLNLELSPPLYIRALKITDEETVLIFQLHHLMFDGKSVQIFVRRLCEAYTLIKSGKQLPTKAPDFRFPSYCKWENQIFQSDLHCNSSSELAHSQKAIGDAFAYWDKTLHHLEAAALLKVDMADGDALDSSGREYVVETDREVVDSILERIPSKGFTPFHLFFAAYSKALFQTLGYSEQAIGFVASLRPEGFENALGCYVTTLPCLIELADDTANNALLAQVRDSTWNALEYGRMPFEAVLERFRSRGQSRDFRGFSTVVSYDEQATRFMQLPEVEVQPRRIHSGFAKFPLSFNIEVTDTGFAFIFEYKTALYRDDTIKRLAQSFLSELSKLPS
ncbi:Tyrocidine synthase 2 [Pseudoalteromonas holothuriae]|uniref:Tyrocidine synthase 2 n=1 Tax=Pseudoalteromonas holothuriae TaxID=2963714 RepID=A0ABN8UMY4_9GAMM|nr:non-ribosomal peptide synthetase [Pseudoalteromonas sp. CIP111951]CAH9059396.1 Tyrocidine synthase 2 [Pseudoalteromonas sp. CIP111951]